LRQTFVSMRQCAIRRRVARCIRYHVRTGPKGPKAARWRIKTILWLKEARLNRLASVLETGFTRQALLLAPPRKIVMSPTPIFQGLGFAPGNTGSEAWAVNADGSVVVGGSYGGTANYQAFEWTAATGMVGIDQSSTPTGRVQANGVSDDGSVIVGFDNNGAFRWTAATGAVDLGPGGAYDVSGDGAVVVGYSNQTQAFRWTASTGMVSLGDLPGYTTSEAYGTNADGSVVVGGSGGSTEQAFEWTAATGMVGLGYLPGYDHSFAYGVSADGSVVVGFDWQDPQQNGSQVNDEAFVWTASGGLTAIGPGLAYRANADGSVVVGKNQNGAFRWTAATGMQSIQDTLNAEGVNLTNWTLTFATGISADGQTIVGEGTSGGNYEAWTANIPLNAFALLDLNGMNRSIGSLLWGGTVTNSGINSPATLTAGGDNTSTAFNGTIKDGTSTTALTKTGTGSLTLSKTNSYSGGTTISGGALELASGASAGSGAIAFAGSGVVLKIDGATMPTNMISGFAPGDTLDFAGATFSSNGSVTLKSGNMLQLVEGGVTFNLQLNPSQNFSEDAFALSSDASGGTDVTVTVPSGSETTEAPSLNVPSSLSVSPGGSIPMGITAKPVDNDDTVSITITGVPSYEKITAGPGETVTTNTAKKSLTTYTITSTTPGASITDLTLTSTYNKNKVVQNTFTVTASDTTSGETATSVSKTVTVTDPPILATNESIQGAASQQTIGGQQLGGAPPTSPSGLDRVVALFNQSIAAGFSDQNQHGALNTNPLSQVVMNQEQFLAQPHHG
jgi:autotransporter-associated beta strand protein/probable HAF family extracellular repeat protein